MDADIFLPRLPTVVGVLRELLETLLAGNGAIRGEEWTMEHRADGDAAKEALNNAVTVVCPKSMR